jgi:hypothetical protein
MSVATEEEMKVGYYVAVCPLSISLVSDLTSVNTVPPSTTLDSSPLRSHRAIPRLSHFHIDPFVRIGASQRSANTSGRRGRERRWMGRRK